MRRRILKIVKITVITAIALFLIKINVPIPINIETSALEIIYDDPDYLEERTVIIRGWYHINVFVRYHEFRGEIIISGYPETQSEIPQRLRLISPRGWTHNLRSDWLIYRDRMESYYTDYTVFGFIFTNFLMRDTMIWVDMGSLSGSPVIVLDAASRDDAARQLRPLFHPHYPMGAYD